MKTNYKISFLSKITIFVIGLISIIATSGILDNNFNPNTFTMFTTITNSLCTIYFIIEAIYQIKNTFKYYHSQEMYELDMKYRTSGNFKMDKKTSEHWFFDK